MKAPSGRPRPDDETRPASRAETVARLKAQTEALIREDAASGEAQAPARLRRAREERGFETAADAARALGMKPVSYAHYENGSLGFSRHAARFATFYGVNLEWLLTGHGPMKAPDRGAALDVPLISWVSAGPLGLAEAVEEYAEAPRVVGPDLAEGGDWIALEVDGTSMDKISPPGSIIFVNRKDRRLVPNACYVIADDHGAATYKRWRADTGWHPVSTDESHKPLKIRPGAEPVIIGRVKLSLIRM
jgi:SOS-response transcriptional repressor LexA